MLRTVQSLPHKGFRRWAPAPPVSRRHRQPATGPPGSYPDRTHTGKRRRAYEREEHHGTTSRCHLPLYWAHEKTGLATWRPQLESSSTSRACGTIRPASCWRPGSTCAILRRASATAAAGPPHCGTTPTQYPRSTDVPPPISRSSRPGRQPKANAYGRATEKAVTDRFYDPGSLHLDQIIEPEA